MSRNLFGDAPRADFTWELRGNVVCIVDHDNGRSVTNDVQAVLADIARDGVNLATHRVIYRDTMGVWDEILLAGVTFSAFRSINETDLSAALRKIGAN